jgi:hypothetical protein
MSNSDGPRSQRKQSTLTAPLPGSELSANCPVEVSDEVSSHFDHL